MAEIRPHASLSQDAIKASFKSGALWALQTKSPMPYQLNDESEHFATAMLRNMSKDELRARKEALENELISVARLLNGLEP